MPHALNGPIGVIGLLFPRFVSCLVGAIRVTTGWRRRVPLSLAG